MNSSKVKPYSDFLYIEPMEKSSIIVSSQRRLQTFGKVLEIGNQVTETKIGDIVAFELWDKPEFEMNDVTYHFIREKDVICKLEL